MLHLRQRWSIPPPSRRPLERDVHAVAVWCSLPKKFWPKEDNGIASASSVKIVTRPWTPSLLAMVPTGTCTARLATARSLALMDTDLLAVLDSSRLMGWRKLWYVEVRIEYWWYLFAQWGRDLFSTTLLQSRYYIDQGSSWSRLSKMWRHGVCCWTTAC